MGSGSSRFSGDADVEAFERKTLTVFGYNPDKVGLQKALDLFMEDHKGTPLSPYEKLQVELKNAQQMVKEHHGNKTAPTMTVGQAHGIIVASAKTHVPTNAFVKLAAAQRAFEPNVDKNWPGKQPGLFQMEPDKWVDTFKQFGKYFPQTRELAEKINAAKKPSQIAKLRHEILEARANPVIAAQIGAEYAKHHPVQLDTLRCYDQQGPGTGKADNARLSNFVSTAGFNWTGSGWCAVTANTVLHAQGSLETTQVGSNNGRLAADFVRSGYGTLVKGKDVKPGDIVVKVTPDGTDNPYQHVGFVDGISGDKSFTILGGNQGNIVQSETFGGTTNEAIVSRNTPRTEGYVFIRPPQNTFAAVESAQQAKLHQQLSKPKS